MDKSDVVAFRHSVAFSNLRIEHSVDLSPTTVALAREVRLCIIALVVGIAGISIVKSVLSFRKNNDK